MRMMQILLILTCVSLLGGCTDKKAKDNKAGEKVGDSKKISDSDINKTIRLLNEFSKDGGIPSEWEEMVREFLTTVWRGRVLCEILMRTRNTGYTIGAIEGYLERIRAGDSEVSATNFVWGCIVVSDVKAGGNLDKQYSLNLAEDIAKSFEQEQRKREIEEKWAK